LVTEKTLAVLVVIGGEADGEHQSANQSRDYWIPDHKNLLLIVMSTSPANVSLHTCGRSQHNLAPLAIHEWS
jgi:hypothetical protein